MNAYSEREPVAPVGPNSIAYLFDESIELSQSAAGMKPGHVLNAVIDRTSALFRQAKAAERETSLDEWRLVAMATEGVLGCEAMIAAVIQAQSNEMQSRGLLPGAQISNPTMIDVPSGIEILFADWADRNGALDDRKDNVAECEAIVALEAAALALPPAAVLDLYRKIAMVLEAPLTGDRTFEAQLAREARTAVGLPVNRA